MNQPSLPLLSPTLQQYSGKKILITGASGFLGHAMLQALSQVPCYLRALTRTPASISVNSGAAHVEVLHWDAHAPSCWSDYINECDVVFHFAAQTSMRTAIQQPDRDAEINTQPVMDMIQACRSQRRPVSIVFASTASIFGCPPTLPVHEDFPDQPLTPYCLHKKLAEGYLKQGAQEGILHAISLRLPNIYGPGREASSKDRSILNRLLEKALRGEPLSVYGEGSEKRDYLFISDTLDAFLRAGLAAPKASGNFYVIGSGKARTLRESIESLQRIAFELTGKSSALKTVNPVDLLVIETRNYEADFTRFHQLTGWTPLTEFEDGLRITGQHLLDTSFKAPLHPEQIKL